MKPNGCEGKIQHQLHCFARVPLAVVGLCNEITEGRVLPRPANDVGQRDASYESIAFPLENSQGIALIVEPADPILSDQSARALEAEEIVVATRLERLKKLSIRQV